MNYSFLLSWLASILVLAVSTYLNSSSIVGFLLMFVVLSFFVSFPIWLIKVTYESWINGLHGRVARTTLCLMCSLVLALGIFGYVWFQLRPIRWFGEAVFLVIPVMQLIACGFIYFGFSLRGSDESRVRT